MKDTTPESPRVQLEAATMPAKGGIVFLIWVSYLASARIGLFFAILHQSITALWPPSGIALAAFYLLGRWVWPGIYLGAFVANYGRGTPFLVSAGIAFGNTLAGFVGSELLFRVKDFRPDFSRIKDVLLFTICAVAVDPVVSATNGVLSLWLGGLLATAGLPSAWLAWWSGDAIGVVIVGPLLLYLSSLRFRVPRPARIAEAAFFLTVSFAVAALVYNGGEIFLFLVYPLSVWAAIRFRHLGVMTLSLLLACVSIPFLIVRVGPQAHLVKADLQFLIYKLQLLLATSGFTGILLAADITSRTRAESSLTEKDRQLRLIVENTPDIIIMQDRDLRYTFVTNPQFGYEKQDILGKTDQDLLDAETAEQLTKLKKEVIETGSPVRMNMPLRTKHGEPQYFDGSCVATRSETGEINGLVGYFRNITDRKNAERNRIAWEESEKTNLAKDQFIATLSHELRTPLTAIIAWAQLIKSGALDPESCKQGIQAIEESAQSQNHLINDLLDVSRIVTGKLVIKAERVDVRAAVNSAIDALRPSAEKKAIRIQSRLGDTPLEAMADPTRLKQVFWNLLSNSIKFTQGQGTIEVAAEAIETDAGPKIRIEVRDDGEGLAPEVIPQLFRRFTQVDSTTTRSNGGMGLGLSLTRSLLEMQAGSVEASSAGLGQGSTFTVLLPRLLSTVAGKSGASALAPRKQAQEPAHLLAGFRVLFVDDEPGNRQAIGAMLNHCGAEVRLAASAAEARASLEVFQPHVILSDIAMPEEDGYSLLRQIRASPNARINRIPAISFTAFSGPDITKNARDAGFQAHLSKPLGLDELVNSILKVASENA